MNREYLRKDEHASASIAYLANALGSTTLLATSTVIMAVSPTMSIEITVLIGATESISADKHTSPISGALVVFVFAKVWGPGLDVDGWHTACGTCVELMAVAVGALIEGRGKDLNVELQKAVDGVDLDRVASVAMGISSFRRMWTWRPYVKMWLLWKGGRTAWSEVAMVGALGKATARVAVSAARAIARKFIVAGSFNGCC